MISSGWERFPAQRSWWRTKRGGCPTALQSATPARRAAERGDSARPVAIGHAVHLPTRYAVATGWAWTYLVGRRTRRGQRGASGTASSKFRASPTPKDLSTTSLRTAYRHRPDLLFSALKTAGSFTGPTEKDELEVKELADLLRGVRSRPRARPTSFQIEEGESSACSASGAEARRPSHAALDEAERRTGATTARRVSWPGKDRGMVFSATARSLAGGLENAGFAARRRCNAVEGFTAPAPDRASGPFSLSTPTQRELLEG